MTLLENGVKEHISFDIMEDCIYIEPISSCNLNCKMCYASILNGRLKKELSFEQITLFIERFLEVKARLKKFEITWCGTGEVFMHKKFPEILNTLNEKYAGIIYHRIITNGTIDRLNDIKNLSNIGFEVSIDGLERQNDWNRGQGTYRKSIDFCKKVKSRNCKSLTIRSILTTEFFDSILDFEREIKREIGEDIHLSFQIPCTNEIIKNMHHAKVTPKINNLKIMSHEELQKKVANASPEIKKLLSFNNPSIQLYLSLNQNGVYCCCEGEIKLGDLNTNMELLLENLRNSINKCRACPLFENYCALTI